MPISMPASGDQPKDWIVPTGSNLTEAIRTELLQTGAAPGSGTIHAEIHTKKMLGYSETTKAVSTPLLEFTGLSRG